MIDTGRVLRWVRPFLFGYALAFRALVIDPLDHWLESDAGAEARTVLVALITAGLVVVLAALIAAATGVKVSRETGKVSRRERLFSFHH